MRRLLALAALAATALLSGCANASAGAVVDTKTPAPVATGDVEAIVNACFEAGIDFYADGVVDGVTETGAWGQCTTVEAWEYTHAGEPEVERIDGGYSVLFRGSNTDGANPNHLCEIVDGVATITVTRD